MAFATAGMVPGLYHRCGFGVLSGKPSRFCTTTTLRDELGAAFSIVFMNPSYPTPFCTTSWAALTSRATDALASKVCGSVFGLLMMALTWTYLPPTCWMTSAYSFSAPTATILPPPEPDARSANDEEQRLAHRGADRHDPCQPPPAASHPRRSRVRRCHLDGNDNGFQFRLQHDRR